MERIINHVPFNLVVILLLCVSITSYGQSRQEKTDTIIHKLNLLEMPKMQYQFQIDPLKSHVSGNDSLKLLELEQQLAEENISRVVNEAFNEHLSDAEIDDVYSFLQSAAYSKLFTEGVVFKFIDNHYSYINKGIERITNNLGESIKTPVSAFVPIPIDREDGFYVTVDYDKSTDEKNFRLEEKPSLTTKDILEVKKKIYGDEFSEISIQFTKEAAQKFYSLTKKNIGKPLAIVLGKQIVSMPTINAAIIGGAASITGSFTDEELDEMVDRLKEKE